LNQAPDISIVIPVFNAEDYLNHCAKSIIAQGFSNLEVLLIDDGSQDDSASIIKEICESDHRFKGYFVTANGGAPAARNIGIENLCGRYTLFMDVDDELLPDALHSLFSQAQSTGSDAVKGTMIIEQENGARRDHALNQRAEFIGVSLGECEDIEHLYQYTTYLFNTSFLKDSAVYFDEDLKNFQDPVFLSRLLPVCNTIDVIMTPVYLRKHQEGSIITSRWNYENFISLIHGTDRAYQSMTESGHDRAAAKVALTFHRWWARFERAPETVTEIQHLQLLEAMHEFSIKSRQPISQFSFTKSGAFHCLRLIEKGDIAKCHALMFKRSRSTLWHTAMFRKSMDLAGCALAYLKQELQQSPETRKQIK
tara:strand:+ start:30384 stop:31481 length:1098 start_codon:yes stop_codon:yes gene_type:complete